MPLGTQDPLGVEIDVRCQQVDFEGQFVTDLTEFLIQEQSWVSRDMCRRVHGAGTLRFSVTPEASMDLFNIEDPPWQRIRLRPGMRVRGQTDADWGPWDNLGAYLCTNPSRIPASDPPEWSVGCQDLLDPLDSTMDQGLVIAAQTPIIDAIETILTLPGAPLVPRSPVLTPGGAGAVAGSTVESRGWILDNDLTYLVVLDYLLHVSGWRTPWVDRNGFLTSAAWEAPGAISPTAQFEASRGDTNVGGTEKINLWQVPNKWIFVRDIRRRGHIPTPPQGDVIVVENRVGQAVITAGPGSLVGRSSPAVSYETSQRAVGRTITAIFREDAISVTAFRAAVERFVVGQAAAPGRACFEVVPQPTLFHRDTINLGVSEGKAPQLHFVQEWKLPFDGGLLHVEADRIAQDVDGPPTVAITATRGIIAVGETTQLEWSAFGATGVSVTGVTNAGLSGVMEVSPTDTTTYTATATGAGGSATSMVTVAVHPLSRPGGCTPFLGTFVLWWESGGQTRTRLVLVPEGVPVPGTPAGTRIWLESTVLTPSELASFANTSPMIRGVQVDFGARLGTGTLNGFDQVFFAGTFPAAINCTQFTPAAATTASGGIPTRPTIRLTLDEAGDMPVNSPIDLSDGGEETIYAHFTNVTRWSTVMPDQAFVYSSDIPGSSPQPVEVTADGGLWSVTVWNSINVPAIATFDVTGPPDPDLHTQPGSVTNVVWVIQTHLGDDNIYVSVFWTRPDSGGYISGFEIERRVTNGPPTEQYQPIGTQLGGITVYQDTSVFRGDQYSYRVRAVGPGGDGDYGVAEDVVDIPALPTEIVPGAVTGVNSVLQTHLGVNDLYVSVFWTRPSSGGDISGFEIERRVTNGPATETYQSVGTQLGGVTVFRDTSVFRGDQYSYRVRAVGPGGNGGYGTDPDTIMIPALPTEIVPGAVTGVNSVLQTHLGVNDLYVSVFWTRPSSGGDISGFEIERRVTNGPATETYQSVGTQLGGVTVFRDTSVFRGDQYSYRVRAVGPGGNGGYGTDPDTIMIPALPTEIVPGAVTGVNSVLQTHLGVNDLYVSVFWTRPSSGGDISGFEIERRVTNGPATETYQSVGTQLGGVTVFRDTSVFRGDQYSYRVRAVGPGGNGGYGTDPDTIMIPALPTEIVPGAVTGVNSVLQTHLGVNDLYVSVFWTRPSSGGDISGFEIERRVTNGPATETYQSVGTQLGGVTVFRDTSVFRGDQYSYRVRAVGPGGNGGYGTDPDTIMIPALPTEIVPGAVTGVNSVLQTHLGVNDLYVSVFWTRPSSGGDISGFEIERRVTNGPATETYQSVGTQLGGVTVFRDTSVFRGDQYSYRVRAVGPGGNGGYGTDPDTIMIPALPTEIVPGAVTGVNSVLQTHLGVNDLYVSVFWTRPSSGGDISGFEIERRVTNGPATETYQSVGTQLGGVTVFRDTSVFRGDQYSYRVRAVGPGGNGGYGTDPDTIMIPALPAQTVPANPASATTDEASATFAGNTSYYGTLVWTAGTGGGEVTGFEIERSFAGSSPGPGYLPLATVGLNSRSYNDWTVVRGVSYTYRVRAIGPGGESGWRVGLGTAVIPALQLPTAVRNLRGIHDVSDQDIDSDWDQPSGGDPPIVYDVDINGNVEHEDVTDTQASVDTPDRGLTPEIGVTPLNEAGEGPRSAVDVPVISSVVRSFAVTVDTDENPPEVRIRWTTPQYGDVPTTYEVERAVGGTSSNPPVTLVGSGLTVFTVTDTPGEGSWRYRARAVNAVGDGPWSSWVTVDVPSAPGAVIPASVTGSSTGETSVRVRWTVPSDLEGTNGWRVQIALGPTVVETRVRPLTDRSEIFTGLIPNTLYTVQVAGLSDGDPSISTYRSDTVRTDTATTTPGLVRSLRVVGETEDELDVDWSTPADNGGAAITSYSVQYRRTGTTTWFNVSRSGTSTSETIENLREDTSYQIQVAAINSNGTGPYDSTSGRTDTATTTPGLVRSLRVVGETEDELDVDWSTPADNGGAAITSYSVQYRRTGTTTWFNVSRSGTSTSETIENLREDTSYQIQVAAINSNGTGPYDSTSGRTDTATTTPGLVRSLRVVGETEDELDVDWSTPADNGGAAITSYSVQYRRTGTTTWFNVSRSGTSTSETIENLREDTSYQIQVAAINSNGTGPYDSTSGRTDTATTTPGLVRSLRVVGETEDELDVDWSTPADNGGAAITSYSVQYRRTGTTTWFNVSRSGTSTSETIENLREDTSYQIQVAAINSNGTGPYDSTSGRTDAAAVRPTASISATPSTWAIGETSTLRWSTTNANTVRVESQGGTLVSTLRSGQRTINGPGVVGPYSYTIEASGPGGTATDTVNVTIEAADTAPSAVRNLAASLENVFGSTVAKITWTAPSTGTTPFIYNVVRLVPGFGFVTIEAGITSRTASEVNPPSGNWTYVVNAVSDGGQVGPNTEVDLDVP